MSTPETMIQAVIEIEKLKGIIREMIPAQEYKYRQSVVSEHGLYTLANDRDVLHRAKEAVK